ncbi:hypothetical protein F66182_7569 [Fusarium sp. NRRL 66182]|nr:hypothetical protein F66182_7569 [Fusarium sp. NRRL 66182]
MSSPEQYHRLRLMACRNDDTFGPIVQGCRGNFDFTVQFEEIFFSVVPSCLFLILALVRLLQLSRKPSIGVVTAFFCAKLAVIVTYAALQLSQLVLASQNGAGLVKLSVHAEALRFAVTVTIFLVSLAEHMRNPRPSILLGGFLCSTLLVDVVRTRTLWLLISHDGHHMSTRASIAVTTTALKGIILILEAQHKRYSQEWKDNHSPEETSGIFSLSTYSWLGQLLFSGFRSVLSISDLYALDQTMSASSLQAKMNQRGAKQSEALSWLLFTSLKIPLLLPAIPRLALIGFTFCQPFLIQTILRYLESRSEPEYGYGLIGGTILIYTGMAISNALYSYLTERFVCMARGFLFTAVYEKTILLPTAAANDSAVLTLMNSDIDRIKMGLLPLHEYWANTVEVVLAAWLLEQQLGAAFAAPIVVVVVCIVASGWVASITGRRQVAWMEAIEERVAATASTILAIKTLRISGMVGAVEELIQGLRKNELTIGGKWRLMLVAAVTLSFTPTTIGPVMAFAVTSRSLEVTRIFPALAYIMLLTGPLSILLQDIPNLMSAFACLGRIDAYMAMESRIDPRLIPQQIRFSQDKVNEPRHTPALKVTEGYFGWVAEKMVLRDINMKIPAASLTIIFGPVASGKSTLLKALLGETTFSTGTIALGANFRRVGYCDQTPFLLNDSIQANIIGHAPLDAARYQQVLYSSALEPDLRQLPQGDGTIIGGNGISLSGGQKQRVALARALYLDAELYLLDDILSGLDASTSSLVFQRTLGPHGILTRSRAAVVLCTHDERYLQYADKVQTLSEDGLLTTYSSVEDPVAAVHLQKDAKAEDDATVSNGKTFNSSSHAEVPIDSHDPLQVDRQDQARQLGDFSVYRYYFSNMANWVIYVFVLSCCCYGFTSNFPTVWLKYWAADVVRLNPSQPGAFHVGIYALLQTLCLMSITAVVLVCSQSMISQTGFRLHQSALKTVINAPLGFFTLVATGTVTNHFAQDLTLIDSELPLSLLNFALSLFGLMGMAAVIAIASPWLAVAYPLLISLVYYIQLFYLRTSRQLRLLDLDSRGPLYSHFIDTLSGLITLRALGYVSVSVATSNRLLDTSQRPTYLLAMVQRWLELVLRLLVMLLAAIIVTLATQLRTDSGFTGATLVTLMGFGDMLAVMVQSYTTLETSIGAVARLKTFSSSTEQESKPDSAAILDDTWPQNGHIQVEHVSASYSTKETPSREDMALQDISITFSAGERVAIVGRTGSGKSSLVLLLLRILDPLPITELPSRVVVDHVSLKDIDRDLLRRRIIAISQDAIFLPSGSGSTLRSNLDPFHQASDLDLQEVLELHGLGFLASVQEESTSGQSGIDSSFTTTSLSQGQKQLFNLARAVIRRRVRYQAGARGGILLLDEVSSSVDSATNDKMWKIIENEFAGYTTVMIVHRLDLAIRCDRVIVMDGGRVAESGRPDELRARSNGYFKTLLDTTDLRNLDT